MSPKKKKKIPVRRIPVRESEEIGPVRRVPPRVGEVETPLSNRGGGLRVRGGGPRVRGSGSGRGRGRRATHDGTDDGDYAGDGDDEGTASDGAGDGDDEVTPSDGSGDGATAGDGDDGAATAECEDGNDGSDARLVLIEDGCEVFVDEEEVYDEVVNQVDNEIPSVVEERHQDLVEIFGEATRDSNCQSDEDSGDDIWDDDRIPDPLSSDSNEDDDERERRHERRLNRDTDELLALGKTFNSPEDFKMAVLRYSLKTRYDVKLYRSQATKIGAKCTDCTVNCQWRVYCSYEKRKHKMQIKVYVNEHTCVRSGYSHMLNTSTIAWLFSERIRINPKITKQEMVSEIKREYNLVVSEWQCVKAKSKLFRERKVSHEEHFSRLWDYQAQVFKSNVNTKFEIETTPGATIGSKQRFYRCFICFSAQQQSWIKTCRPIIGLDGAFLKWDIKGHLLAVVGRDGDNRIVPIAWAIVEVENDTNWDWFVKHLSQCLDVGDGSKIAVISDKHRGIINAVKNILPQAEHRQCCRHILDNWKKDNRDHELERLFWKIARSYTQGEYVENMELLRSYNANAYLSLQKTNPASWSRAFFRIGSCCNDNLNNLCESFNRTIRQARRKPLMVLLEDIRKQCLVRNEKRSVIAGRLKTRFTRRAHVQIERMIAGAQHCIIHMARNDLHEVELNDVSYCVDMNTHTCSCRKWQMVGIPCVHATSVFIRKKQNVQDWVNEYYTTRMWQETYKEGIAPVPGKPFWPRLKRLPVLPPPWRNGNPGRPSNHARKRGRNESSSSTTKLSRRQRVMTCSNCHQEGHNKKGCKNPTVAAPPKKPKGRPKKYQVQSIGFSQSQGSQSQLEHQGPQPQMETQGPQPQWKQQRSQAQMDTQRPQPQWEQQEPQGQYHENLRSQGWGNWFECST